MHLLRAYILAVGYDYVMLLEKNSHLDATTTLLGNAERGKVMLSSLKTRQEGTYRFFGNSNNSDLIVLLLYNPGATVTLLASPLACEQEIPQITALLNEAIQHCVDKYNEQLSLADATYEPLDLHWPAQWHCTPRQPLDYTFFDGWEQERPHYYYEPGM